MTNDDQSHPIHSNTDSSARTGKEQNDSSRTRMTSNMNKGELRQKGTMTERQKDS